MTANAVLANWLVKRRAIKRCKKEGGHWWRASGMTGWWCINCPATAEGSPKDGPQPPPFGYIHPGVPRTKAEWI